MKSYRVVYIHNSGRIVSKTFVSPVEAKTYYDAMSAKSDVRSIVMSETR